MTPPHGSINLHTVVDGHRGEAVTYLTTASHTGRLSVQWRPPRGLDLNERARIVRAAVEALVLLKVEPL